MKHSLMIAATAIALAAGSYSAEAGCVQAARHQGGAKLSKPSKVPHLPPLSAERLDYNGSIVGLWYVVHYLPDGSVFFDSLEQWHSDGTEFELANGYPQLGNVCLGVWKQIGPRTVQLNHIGWDFKEDGSPDGTFTLTGTAKVTQQGKHWEGPYDVKIYDVDGNLLDEVTGTSVAERIAVE